MYQPALIPLLPGVGPTELIILLTIILLLFGAKKIPELAKGLGTGVREFKKGTAGGDEKDEVKGAREKDGGAIAGGASEDTHNARMQEDAAREESRREEPSASERVEQRSGERNQ